MQSSYPVDHLVTYQLKLITAKVTELDYESTTMVRKSPYLGMNLGNDKLLDKIPKTQSYGVRANPQCIQEGSGLSFLEGRRQIFPFLCQVSGANGHSVSTAKGG